MYKSAAVAGAAAQGAAAFAQTVAEMIRFMNAVVAEKVAVVAGVTDAVNGNGKDVVGAAAAAAVAAVAAVATGASGAVS